MGILVVRHYPTKLFLKAADHTYVECGTGATGWSCWGGKTGGKYLRAAPGSTRRAQDISYKKERARITCYLINGVCHQAANRILTPAEITVDGARGYALSVAIFNTYGKPGGFLGLCKSPFETYPSATGDLNTCIGPTTTAMEQGVSYNTDRLDFTDAEHMHRVAKLYAEKERAALESTDSAFEFQMQHFRLLLDHKFAGPVSVPLGKANLANLIGVKEKFENQRFRAEEALSSDGNRAGFVERFDRLTLQFQADVAEVLDPQAYQTLLNLTPDSPIVLSDPDIHEGKDFLEGDA